MMHAIFLMIVDTGHMYLNFHIYPKCKSSQKLVTDQCILHFIKY